MKLKDQKQAPQNTGLILGINGVWRQKNSLKPSALNKRAGGSEIKLK